MSNFWKSLSNDALNSASDAPDAPRRATTTMSYPSATIGSIVLTASRRSLFTRFLATAFPNIEIAHTQTAKGGTEAAKTELESLLRADADIRAVFATDDAAALGAAQALKAAKNAKAFVVSIGGTSEAVAQLKKEDSRLVLTVALFPQEAGRAAAAAAYKVLAGKPVAEQVRALTGAPLD